MKIFRNKRGVTLVEVTITVALLSVLILGVSAIFLSTQKIYGQGTDRAMAKEFSSSAISVVENKLMQSSGAMLKNNNFGNKSLVFRDGMLVITDGGRVRTIGGSEDKFMLDATLSRINDSTIKLVMNVYGMLGSKLYSASRVMECPNIAISGGKVLIQDSDFETYVGVELSEI